MSKLTELYVEISTMLELHKMGNEVNVTMLEKLQRDALNAVLPYHSDPEINQMFRDAHPSNIVPGPTVTAHYAYTTVIPDYEPEDEPSCDCCGHCY